LHDDHHEGDDVTNGDVTEGHGPDWGRANIQSVLKGYSGSAGSFRASHCYNLTAAIRLPQYIGI
jgi:hypothetical protein